MRAARDVFGPRSGHPLSESMRLTLHLERSGEFAHALLRRLTAYEFSGNTRATSKPPGLATPAASASEKHVVFISQAPQAGVDRTRGSR